MLMLMFYMRKSEFCHLLSKKWAETRAVELLKKIECNFFLSESYSGPQRKLLSNGAKIGQFKVPPYFQTCFPCHADFTPFPSNASQNATSYD